jgi:hypothetical protein
MSVSYEHSLREDCRYRKTMRLIEARLLTRLKALRLIPLPASTLRRGEKRIL